MIKLHSLQKIPFLGATVKEDMPLVDGVQRKEASHWRAGQSILVVVDPTFIPSEGGGRVRNLLEKDLGLPPRLSLQEAIAMPHKWQSLGYAT